MPDQSVVRKFGHKLVELTDAADAVAQKNKLKLAFSRPIDATSVKIVECLDAFADASRGRYANFATLDDPTLSHEVRFTNGGTKLRNDLEGTLLR